MTRRYIPEEKKIAFLEKHKQIATVIFNVYKDGVLNLKKGSPEEVLVRRFIQYAKEELDYSESTYYKDIFNSLRLIFLERYNHSLSGQKIEDARVLIIRTCDECKRVETLSSWKDPNTGNITHICYLCYQNKTKQKGKKHGRQFTNKGFNISS